MKYPENSVVKVNEVQNGTSILSKETKPGHNRAFLKFLRHNEELLSNNSVGKEKPRTK